MFQVDFPPLGAGTRLQFGWDPDTGTLSGRDAAFVMLAVQTARRDGYTIVHPWPTSIPIQDPLHVQGELAAIVSQFCLLDEAWQAALDELVPQGSDLDSLPILN